MTAAHHHQAIPTPLAPALTSLRIMILATKNKRTIAASKNNISSNTAGKTSSTSMVVAMAMAMEMQALTHSNRSPMHKSRHGKSSSRIRETCTQLKDSSIEIRRLKMTMICGSLVTNIGVGAVGMMGPRAGPLHAEALSRSHLHWGEAGLGYFQCRKC